MGEWQCMGSVLLEAPAASCSPQVQCVCVWGRVVAFLRSGLVRGTGDLGGPVAKIFLLPCCDSNKLIFIFQKV